MLNNRQNGRRRGRGGGPRTPNNAPNTGNRQDNRSRGNAAQLHEKYKALARDAQLGGDRVQTEYYLQFADHYFRVLNESRARFEDQRPRRDDFMSEEDEDQDEAANASDGEEQDERDERDDRSDRQERQPRFEREERGDNRPRRQRARRDRFEDRDDRDERGSEQNQDAGEERISLDSLPPAISVIEGGSDEDERAPRRRTRRPRPSADETDIAPAA